MSSDFPSFSDPVERLNRGLRRRLLAGLVLVAGGATWAFLPQEAGEVQGAEALPSVDVATEPEEEAADVLSLEPFHRELWNPPPTPDAPVEAAPTTAPRQPPLRLQLVGVTRVEGRLVAAVYDPDRDDLLLVEDGESIGDLRVSAVTSTGITLEHPGGSRELFLEAVRR